MIKRSPMWTRIIFLLVLFLPFQFATNLFAGADVSVLRLLIFAVFLLAFFAFLCKKWDIHLPIGGVFWIVSVLLILIISTITAHHPEWALRKGFFLVNFFLWYGTLALLVFNERINSQRIVEGIILSGTAIAFVGILQWLGQFVFGLEPMLSVWRAYVAPFFLGSASAEAVLAHSSWLVNVGGATIFRAIAVFPDPHMFAFYLELCAPWALFSFLQNGRKKYMVFFSVMIIALLLSFSRGAYIGIIAGFFVMLAFFVYRQKFRLREGLVMITIFAVSMGFLFGTDNFVRDRLMDTFFSVDASGQERIVLWGDAWRAIEEFPFLGVGLGGFPERVQPSAVYRDPIYAHNLYLDIAVEMGLLGLFVCLAGFYWMVRRFLILGQKNPVYFSGVVALMMYGAHSIFDTPLYSVHVLGILCVTASLAWSSFSSEEKKYMIPNI